MRIITIPFPEPLICQLIAFKKGYLTVIFGIPGTKRDFIPTTTLHDQAWVLAKRLGFKGTYVMKGGLNRWMKTIINPDKPSEEEPSTAFATYEFRKGAMMYFTGAKAGNIETSKVTVPIKRRKKTNVVAGGC